MYGMDSQYHWYSLKAGGSMAGPWRARPSVRALRHAPWQGGGGVNRLTVARAG